MSTATVTAPSPKDEPSYASARIPTLDGWRGVAILLVLMDHFIGIADLGQHGVVVFFVLSGFLITSRLIEEKDKTGTIHFRSFYLRRFFRLCPSAWLFLLFIAFINRFVPVTQVTRVEIFSCVSFFRNFVDQTGKHIFTSHFWSLSIEEQFYLFWPSVLLFLKPSRATGVATILAVAIAVTRLTHWSALSSSNMEATFGTQFRADSLFIGCIAALNRERLKSLPGWVIYAMLVALVLCFFRYHKLIPLHEACVIAGLIVASSQHPETILGKFLQLRLLEYVGVLSYSIYVWQQPFWVVASRYGRPIRLTTPLFLVAVSFALLSYYAVERPIRPLGHRITVKY